MARKPASKKKPTKKASKKAPKSGKAEPGAASAPPEAVDGQLASATARFELGPHEQVLESGLGAPPPGYGLTLVKAWVRSPGHAIAAWDVNDADALARIEAAGWDRLRIRVVDPKGRTVVEETAGQRGGTYHLDIPRYRESVTLLLGLAGQSGHFETLASSAPLRMPPAAPAPQAEPPETVRLPASVDRRVLVAAEPPARAGHRADSREHGPGWRLNQRIEIARTLALDSTGSLELPEETTAPVAQGAPREAGAVPGGEAAGAGSGTSEAAAEAAAAAVRAAEAAERIRRAGSGEGPSSAELAGGAGGPGAPDSPSSPFHPFSGQPGGGGED